MTIVVRLALLGSLWLLGGRAQAQAPSGREQGDDPAGYREAIDEALSELGAHNYLEARALFARAHELYPNARTHRGLGFAEFELHHYVACIAQLERALTAREKPLDDALRADTQRLLVRARTFVGRVDVEAKPLASSLLVDGVERPLGPVMLDAGVHQFELHAAGYEPERRTVEVHGGAAQKLTVVFMRAQHAQSERRSVARGPWLWSALGVVVAGAAVGTYFALRDPDVRTAAPSGGSSGVSLAGGDL